MATVKWSSLANGGQYELSLYHPVLNPTGVVLRFDIPTYTTPYDLYLDGNDDLTAVLVEHLGTGKTVTLLIDPLTVTSTNVTFAGGGKILVGDGLYGNTNDHDGHTLQGTGGNDQLFGMGGDDTLLGGGGRDVLTDMYGSNIVSGGAGDDFFYVLCDVGSSTTATGGAGRDFYYLDYESPSLLQPPGYPGNDYTVTDFAAGPDGDVIYTSDLVYLAIGYTDEDPFAAGFLRLVQLDADTVVYEGDRDGAAGLVHDWMALITLDNVDADNLSLAHNFPDLQIGTAASELLTGTDRADLMPALLGNDTMSGLAGNDYLAGAEGSDVLDGGAGIDSMLGGSGGDIYYVDHADDAVIETSNTPGGLLLPGGETDPGQAGTEGIVDLVKAAVNFSVATLPHVENITLIGAASRAIGNDLANRLVGNAGVDTLLGGPGNDTLDGKKGGDRINGGTGNDRITWGAGDSVNGGAGTDTLKVAGAALDLTTLAGNRILNVERIELAGTATLKLNLQDLLAFPGDDLKVLGSGADTVDFVGTQGAGTAQGAFTRYALGGGASLLIDTDINVV